MMTHDCAEGDQADESVGRQQAQRHDQSFLERLKLVLVHARVDDIQEHRRNLGRAGERVLDGRVLGKQLCREVRSGDILVMGREGVALKTEGTDPQLSPHVNLTMVSAIRLPLQPP